MRIVTVFAAAVLLVSACSSTNPMLVPTGGSRADATVEMSYQYGVFESPKIDMEQGRVAAEQRCKAWGYKSAEPFGGEQRQCNSFYNGSCMQFIAKVTYQCLG